MVSCLKLCGTFYSIMPRESLGDVPVQADYPLKPLALGIARNFPKVRQLPTVTA